MVPGEGSAGLPCLFGEGEVGQGQSLTLIRGLENEAVAALQFEHIRGAKKIKYVRKRA